ncbi:MAG: diguanylate cyclase [Desulfobacterales bacterium]|nr:diguanylate cyclase [Desulfobacterales bacterium]
MKPSGYAEEIRLSLSELNLTRQERHWLDTSTSIRIAGPRAFPPFHYFDDTGKLKGIAADYIFTIMNQIGIEIEVMTNLPWPQVLEGVRAGEIDLIPCAAMAEDRKAYMRFSTPYLSFPLVILSRKDAPFIGGISDLHGKRLAIIRKNAILNWLDRDGISYDPYYVGSPLKRIEAISLGKVDAAIENLAAASYLIQAHGLTNVKIAAPTPYGNYNLHMAVRKDLPELLGIVNKVIQWITPEQHMRIRSNWLSVRYEHGIRTGDVVKWVLVVIVAAALILAVILIWNRKLKREVEARVRLIGELEQAIADLKRADEKVARSEAKFRELFESSRDAVMILDRDKGFVNCNNAALKVFGCSRADEFLGKQVVDFSPPFQPSGAASSDEVEIHLDAAQVRGGCFFEWQHKSLGGDTFPAEIMLSAVEVEGRQMFQALIRDITRRKAMEDELKRLASKDPLTGANNRRVFLEKGAYELSRSQRYHHAFAVLMIDVDRFKSINDTYGHQAGDEVLKALVYQSRQIIRETDIFGRLGGEEFAVILPETDADTAAEVGERLRSALADIRVGSEKGGIRFTVSLGLGEMTSYTDSLQTIIGRADAALYKAKEEGRNRLVKA